MVSIVVSLMSQVFLIEVSRVVKEQPCMFGRAEITFTLSQACYLKRTLQNNSYWGFKTHLLLINPPKTSPPSASCLNPSTRKNRTHGLGWDKAFGSKLCQRCVQTAFSNGVAPLWGERCCQPVAVQWKIFHQTDIWKKDVETRAIGYASKSGRARIDDFRRCLWEIPTRVEPSQTWISAAVTMENFPLEIPTPVEFSQTWVRTKGGNGKFSIGKTDIEFPCVKATPGNKRSVGGWGAIALRAHYAIAEG